MTWTLPTIVLALHCKIYPRQSYALESQRMPLYTCKSLRRRCLKSSQTIQKESPISCSGRRQVATGIFSASHKLWSIRNGEIWRRIPRWQAPRRPPISKRDRTWPSCSSAREPSSWASLLPQFGSNRKSLLRQILPPLSYHHSEEQLRQIAPNLPLLQPMEPLMHWFGPFLSIRSVGC